MAATSPACDLMLVSRWVASDYNVADGDSREGGNDATPKDAQACRSVVKPCEFPVVPNVPNFIENASPWIDFCVEREPTKVRMARMAGRPRRVHERHCRKHDRARSKTLTDVEHNRKEKELPN